MAAGLLGSLVLVVLLTACGGGDSDSAGPSEKQAGETARQFFMTTLGVFTGHKTPQQLIDLYAPECRDKADANGMAATMAIIRAFLPGIEKIDVQDVDLGELKYEKTDAGLLVAPVDPQKIRVKAGGQFMDMGELFSSIGFSDSGATSDVTNDPILIVERNGKALIGDCSSLNDFVDGGSGP